MKLLTREESMAMKMPKTQQDIIDNNKSFTECWELTNRLELDIEKYNYKDECDISVKLPGRAGTTITQEVFDHLIKFDKYKDILRLDVTLFDSKWIIVPKHLCSSVMEYIETLDVSTI